MLYQQGDVLLETTARIPAEASRVPRSPAGYVLAEGEATGHAHTAEGDVEVLECEGRLYCHSTRSFTLRHQEHRPLRVPAGAYEVRRVREFDYFTKEAREVMD